MKLLIMGNLGFLADLTPKNLTESLLNVLDGKFVEDKRFFIEANISKSQRNCLALNEIVIHSGAIAQMVEYDLFIDGGATTISEIAQNNSLYPNPTSSIAKLSVFNTNSVKLET